ncbi:MAG: GGDEF domain-containing protein [Gammaproteobacteria bacterium]
MSTAPTSAQVIRRLLARAPAIFAALLALTGALLVWHHYGMEKVLEVSARSGHEYVTASDSETGGSSRSEVIRSPDALHLHCNLVKDFAWPYCNISFTMGKNEIEGADLSRYDYLTLDATYLRKGERKLRFFMIEYEHGFSKPKVWDSNKVIELDTFELPANGRISIPLDLFHTATWWKDKVKPPMLRTDTRIDNVIYFQVQTGPEHPLGEHDIIIRSIRFHGKAISFSDLLLGIVGMWILVAVAWPATMYMALKNELSDSKAEVQLLNEVNRALRLETRELADQAHTDALTGALNRQGLRAYLMQAGAQSSAPMSLIFADIDHFKSVNDTHGHRVGDMVLQQFAATVSSLVRSQDKLVRWGGEEFLLLCPMTEAAQAAALAEKLRLAVQQCQWPNDLKVTSSFGVAQRRAGEEIGLVIERADAQLYSAKACGRNRVHTDGIERPATTLQEPALS